MAVEIKTAQPVTIEGYTSEQLALGFSSIYGFSTVFLKSPVDVNIPFKPFNPQITLFNMLDFGYDLLAQKYRSEVKAEIITMLFPRQRGKTEGCGAAALSLAVRYPGSQIGIISAGEAAAKDFLDRIKRFIETSPFVDMVDSERTDRIIFKNGSKILSLPNSKKAIRGKSFRWLFIDEAALIEDEIIDGSALPTVSGAGAFQWRGTPSVVLLSTPQGPKGRFYDYYVQGLDTRDVVCVNCGNRRPLHHEDFKTTRFHAREMPTLPPCVECGGEEYEYNFTDIITVTLDPYTHPFKTRAQIERELDIRGNTPLARQELLGEIIMDESGVFSREWLENATDQKLVNREHPVKDTDYSMGVDFGKMHDNTVFILGHKEDNKVIQDYVDVIPSQGGVEYRQIRYRLLKLIYLYNPRILVLDSTGLGDPIVEQINYDIIALQSAGISGEYKDSRTGRTIKYEIPFRSDVHTTIYNNKNNRFGYVFDYSSKMDLIDNLSNLYQRNLIKIQHEYTDDRIKRLWKELINFGYEYTDSNRIKYGTQREHDDYVIAQALMAWGCRDGGYYFSTGAVGGQYDYVL